MMARVSAGWYVLCAAQAAAWVLTSAAGCGYDASGEGGGSVQDETLFRSGGSAHTQNKGNAAASEGDAVSPPASSGGVPGSDNGGADPG